MVKHSGSLESVEPFTAVREPPTEGENWECSGYSPPEWQNQIGHETDASKTHPENLALHRHSVACFGEPAVHLWQICAVCDTTSDQLPG